MEKRTIGSFIAALRKANGLTQKDLAEKLNVSDKTVSRWECDDGAPDISMIPVIAEIFDISCDELLRGERRPAGERAEGSTTPKADKQRQRLLAVTKSGYQTKSFISAGISIGGLLAAMVCNFGFLRGYIGCFLGTVFFLISVICQAVFLNQVFLAVSDDSLAEEEIGAIKWTAVCRAEGVIGLNVLLFAFCLPLAVVGYDAYSGLTAETMIQTGFVYVLIALALYGTVCYFLNPLLMQRNICTLNGKKRERYDHNHRLKFRCVSLFLAVCLVTLAGNGLATRGWNRYRMAEGKVFDDYESFAEYMEQDIRYSPYDGWENISETEKLSPDTAVYYDMDGNIITEEEALTETLTDKNGKVLVQYLRRNDEVDYIFYSGEKSGYLPITVITEEAARKADEKIAVWNVAFAALYCMEAVAVICIYFKKRMK